MQAPRLCAFSISALRLMRWPVPMLAASRVVLGVGDSGPVLVVVRHVLLPGPVAVLSAFSARR